MNLMLAVVYDAFTAIEVGKFKKLFLHKVGGPTLGIISTEPKIKSAPFFREKPANMLSNSSSHGTAPKRSPSNILGNTENHADLS
jgi:hypothetical protein